MTPAATGDGTARPISPAPTHRIAAGDLSLLVDGVDLRRVILGGVPVMDRVFVAIRDVDWGTLPPIARGAAGRRDATRTGRVDLVFRVLHDGAGRSGSRWQGRIQCRPGPRLSMAMDGMAEASFRTRASGSVPCSRPTPWPAGRSSAAGPARRGQASSRSRIAPQLIVDGSMCHLVPRSGDLDVALPDALLHLAFEGDDFELEDQRNWTDDSFKAYSLMAGEPYPRAARPGQSFRQRLTLTVASLASGRPGAGRVAACARGHPRGHPLPAVDGAPHRRVAALAGIRSGRRDRGSAAR